MTTVSHLHCASYTKNQSGLGGWGNSRRKLACREQASLCASSLLSASHRLRIYRTCGCGLRSRRCVKVPCRFRSWAFQLATQLRVRSATHSSEQREWRPGDTETSLRTCIVQAVAGTGRQSAFLQELSSLMNCSHHINRYLKLKSAFFS